MPQVFITLLTAGMLFCTTTVQAFSWCFSSGGKGRASAYSHTPHYQPYATWLPPALPAMPFSYAPHPGSYYYPKPPETDITVVTEENQGLDYIMQ